MSLERLFVELAEVFNTDSDIERFAKSELESVPKDTLPHIEGVRLPSPLMMVMAEHDAHPICRLISDLNLPWAPPSTSDNPEYIAHSLPKVHVELLGPGGLVKSSRIRLGLYGMLPNFEYGIRTHPAEEVFIMLAGAADWIKGDKPYQELRSGQRAFHPSMTPHANRTRDHAFMSVYVWRGNVSTDEYVYEGIPGS